MMFLSLAINKIGDARSVARDLVPPLATASPCVRFHRGLVVDNQPRIEPALPSIPGGVSPWYVAQWQHRDYLAASDLVTSTDVLDRETLWSFALPDGEAKLQIRHRQAKSGSNVYDLFEHDGVLTEGGGSNLFLAAQAVADATFDHEVALDVTARVTDAAVRYDTASAEATGAVLAMGFVGLGLLEQDPRGAQFVFMQIPLTSSRPAMTGPGYICSLAGGSPRLLFAPFQSGSLPFQPGTERHVHADLTASVAAMLAHPYPCGGTMRDWSAAARNPAHWRLTGIYAGLEVENEDHRHGAALHGPQGDATLGLEIDALSVRSR